MNKITVVTPTYNRAKELNSLYKSLLNQSVEYFDWLIIDDGSVDNTKEVIQDFIKDKKLNITYLKKENGGKHTALNIAIRVVNTELFFIVDSDDLLTHDAIETILSDWNNHCNKNICGIGYLRGDKKGNVIGDKYPSDNIIDNFIHLRYNKSISGDKAEVWVTKSLKRYCFPEFDGEHFISESVLWIKVSRNKDMLFRNKIIYITEYLAGGLSDTGRALRFKCPNGMIYGSLETMSKEFSFKIRYKQALLYIVYSKFGRRSIQQIIRCPYPFLVIMAFLPGMLLYKYWKKEYKL